MLPAAVFLPCRLGYPGLNAVITLSAAQSVECRGHAQAALGGDHARAGGFVLLAALPVVLDWSEPHAGPERAGAAVGFLLLAGNLGGVVLVLILQGLTGNPYLSLGALSAAALAGGALAARLLARAEAVSSGASGRSP